MAQEISKRLKQGKYTSRQLGLRIMTRSPDAPVDAPKFLGHGVCQTSSASKPLSPPTDDEKIIGSAAWRLMSSLGIPPAELRGIAITMTKLLKNGKDPRAVVASDQKVLSFGTSAPRIKPPQLRQAPPPPASRPPPSSPPTPLPIASTPGRTLRPRNPSIIILSDSDSSPPPAQAPPRKALPAASKRGDSAPPSKAIKTTTKASRVAEVKRKKGTTVLKIPAMFGVVKKAKPNEEKAEPVSALTDDDLRHFNFDPGCFRAIPLEDQIEAWNAVKITPAFADWQKGTTNKKRSTSVSAASPRKAPPPRPPGEAEAVSDERLLALGFDLEVIHSLSPTLKREVIEEKIEQIEALTVHGAGLKITSRPVGDVKEWAAPAPLRFERKSDLDELRSLLEKWVDEHDTPLEEEERRLGTYLGKLVDRTVGRDAAKAEDLLGWIKYLVDSKYGMEEDVYGRAGVSWWACVRHLDNLVSRAMRGQFGGQ